MSPTPQMRTPVTDAVDDTNQLESLEVELRTKQIEWLRQKADERNLSLDRMLQSIIAAQIQAQSDREDELPASPASGDGLPSSDDETNEAGDDSASIVDSLRSASERLQELTEQDDEAETRTPNTLDRLQARLGEPAEADEEVEDSSGDAVVLDGQNRSMFDMMDDVTDP